MRPACYACALLIAALAAARLRAQEAGTPPAVPARQFTVPLHDGQLDGADLVRALLEEYELDAGAIALPDVRVDLRGGKGMWMLLGARVLLLETVRFRRDLEQQQLVVTIDRERTRVVRRQLRARLSRLVGRLRGEEVRERQYELALPSDLDRRRPLAVLVHGVESDASIWDDFRAFLQQQRPAPQIATFSSICFQARSACSDSRRVGATRRWTTISCSARVRSARGATGGDCKIVQGEAGGRSRFVRGRTLLG